MQITATLNRLRRYWLFRRPDTFTSPVDLIVWWELRRIPYNLTVGAAGFVTCGSLVGIALIRSSTLASNEANFGSPFFGIFSVALYAIMANICYTAGWISELMVRRFWGDVHKQFGEIVFISGFVFSFALTLLPLLVLGPLAILTK